MSERPYWGTVSAQMPAAMIAAAARQAEEDGKAGLFAAQVFGPPWIPLAAAATATERIQLASGIAIAAARSPFETAMAAIDMDRISNGRFVLGLGTSVKSWTEGLFGAPEHRPIAHLRETIVAVRHIIAGAHGRLEPFEGEWYKADFAELQPTPPPPRQRIPIWIAALRGAMTRLGAEVADGIMGHPIWSLQWAEQTVQRDLEAGLERAGRSRADVELNLWFWCAPNPDRVQAIDDARGTVAFYAGIEQYESFFAAHGFEREARELQRHVKEGDVLAHAHLVPDEMARTFVMCGTPSEVAEQVERAWRIADSLVLNPPFYGGDMERLGGYQARIEEIMSRS